MYICQRKYLTPGLVVDVDFLVKEQSILLKRPFSPEKLSQVIPWTKQKNIYIIKIYRLPGFRRILGCKLSQLSPALFNPVREIFQNPDFGSLCSAGGENKVSIS